jgi:DNA-binding transcriptional regulator YiaG
MTTDSTTQPYADEEPDTTEGPGTSMFSPDEVASMIAETGLSQREWAHSVAGRSSRTVRKWLKGGPISSDACDYLRRIERVKVTPTTITITVVR